MDDLAPDAPLTGKAGFRAPRKKPLAEERFAARLTLWAHEVGVLGAAAAWVDWRDDLGDDPPSPGDDEPDGACVVATFGADQRFPAWNSNLQPDFNVRVCDRFDASSSAVLRELDESDRFVQKSAESTST